MFKSQTQAAAMTNRIYIKFSECGQHIRKWSREPFDGGRTYKLEQNETQECPPLIGGTGAVVTGRSNYKEGRESSQDEPLDDLDLLLSRTDRLHRPDCPFCGGQVDIIPMVPVGWNIKINHSDDCAIAQMSGVRCPDDSARDQFIAAWSNRPTRYAKEQRDG